MSAIYRLLPQLASIMQTFNKLGSQHTVRLLSQLHQYGSLTDKQVGAMRLQAATLFTTTFLSGTTELAAALFPQGAASPQANLDPRSGANSGMEDFLGSIVGALQDNDFMHSTLKTASKASSSLGDGFRVLIQSSITRNESESALIRQVGFQTAQEGQNWAQEAIRKANELADRIIEKKGRGG